MVHLNISKCIIAVSKILFYIEHNVPAQLAADDAQDSVFQLVWERYGVCEDGA